MWEKFKDTAAGFLKPYVLIIVAIGLAVIYIQYQEIKHQRLEVAARDAKVDTLAQEFKVMKQASIESANIYKSQFEAQKAAYDRFGADVLTYMKVNHGELQTIHDAVGRVNESVGYVNGKVSSLPDGSYSGTLTQNRPDAKGGTLPPLTAVKLDFNPATKDLKQSWQNNEEEFDFSLGTWKLEKGGYASAVTGKRSIYKSTNGQRQLVGEEPITFKSGVATFTEKAFVPDGTALSVPRLTLSLGIGKDMAPQSLGKTVLAGGFDYRFSNKVGAGINFIGTSVAGTLSWRPKFGN